MTQKDVGNETSKPYSSEIKKIQEVLEDSPRGLTGSDISALIGISRNTLAKYLDVMHALGLVELKEYGPAKVWFLAERIPLASFMDYMSSGIMALDENLIVRMVNRTQLGSLGKPGERIVGRKASEVDDMWGLSIKNEMVEEIYRNALGGKLYELYGVQVKSSKTGRVRYFDFKVYPAKFSSGKRAVVVIRDDVTEKKRMGEKLKEYHDRLEELAEKRAAELATASK